MMIIEQAFIALPELLLGNQYVAQDYEAGIVGLFMMALLQELNGRNVNDPISHLQAERRYEPDQPRRADLYVNIRNLMTANKKLSAYGWRHHNWLEAKFYRNKPPIQRHATNKASHQGQLIADLIRLTCLVPFKLGSPDTNGRYFLHVYDDEPKYYLPYVSRPWVKALHTAGRQPIDINNIHDESGTAKGQFGEVLEVLRIKGTVTNIANFPIDTQAGNSYWCVLTRFDEFTVSRENRFFRIKSDRTTEEGSPGDHQNISHFVAENLGQTKESEKTGGAVAGGAAVVAVNQAAAQH
jgi:hypothetical protein